MTVTRILPEYRQNILEYHQIIIEYTRLLLEFTRIPVGVPGLAPGGTVYIRSKRPGWPTSRADGGPTLGNRGDCPGVYHETGYWDQ